MTTNGNGDDEGDGKGFVTRAHREVSWFNGDAQAFIDLYGVVRDTVIRFAESSDNAGGGFILEATTDGDVTIADARANGNADDAYQINPPDSWFRPDPADPSPARVGPYEAVYLHHLLMQRCEAIGNLDEGFQLESSDQDADDPADIEDWLEYITLVDITSRDNGDDGFELGASEAVALERIEATGNGEDGIEIATSDPGPFTNYAPWTITARDIIATGNGWDSGDNIEFEARGDITLQVVEASDKAAEGSGDGIELITWVDGDILLEDCRADNNPDDDGIDVNAAGSLTIRRCQSNGNAADGIDTAKTNATTGAVNEDQPNRNLNTLIEDVIVEMNGDDGIQTYAESSTTIRRACVRQNADAGIFVMGTDGNLAITDCVSDNNAADGICLRDLTGGSYTVGGTNIAGNAPGLRNLFAGTTSATGNWWGAASGPNHPDNPGGTGDTIIDGDNGGQGTVNFSPVLGTPPAGPVNCESVIQETPDEPAQALTGPHLQVRVDKVFDDGNPGEVTVRLSCNTGLPLEQSKVIAPGDGVVFIVQDFDSGELDCVVTEEPVPGYLPTYTATLLGPLVAGSASAPNSEACSFDDIQSGEVVCEIENALQPITFTVTKEWVINNPQPNEPTDATASWTCSSQADVDGVVNQGGLSFSGMVATDTFAVYPHWDGGTTCTVDEVAVDDTTEADASNCTAVPVAPGDEPACTLVNTRFYEGIPVLGERGRWLLALLLAGLAAWVLRRPL
ncbi:right-handed parallel beta-helix repeat-containing protein [Elongatibacter sediminis]|uniref:Right-handed parallel beta-helix repeat-containing protein n=1 Tax=Elongatibacter sediminis TaxID=3119006 RepID=A0AAW9RQ50_9GAMM